MTRQVQAEVVMLMGPTASGKTDLAVELVQRLPLEIISVDSALVYRGMDIGTAKPDAATLAMAPHHLLDIRDPAQPYSAADFRDDALRLIEDIRGRDRIPFLVGGTMLYFRALQYGLADMPSADPEIRKRLRAELRARGAELMHRRLAQVDPVSATRIHVNDPQRLLRALEVYELSGRPLSAWHGKTKRDTFPYRTTKLILAPAREVLRERAALRFGQMLASGFEDEMRTLLARGDLDPDLPSMRSVGYRQLGEYLRGQAGLEQAAERAIIATRQLAKRQMTWLRSEPDAQWLNPAGDVLSEALQILTGAPISPNSGSGARANV